MGLLGSLLGGSDDGDEPTDDRPCNETGHGWRHTGVSAYHTSGVPHFGRGNAFTVKRKDRYECTKCGKVDFRRKKVGTVKVDKETDELTVVQ